MERETRSDTRFPSDNRVPVEGIFAALRDGYRFEAQQVCGRLRSEVEGAGRKPAPGLVASANYVNQRMGDWLADLPRRLEHDLSRASREVVADALAGRADVERAVAEFLSEHRPPALGVNVDPLLLPASRAAIVAVRSGSGAAIVLWVLSTLLIPEAWRDYAYLLSVLIGVSFGLLRFQQRQAEEGERGRRLIGEHLERTSLQVAAAIEGYVVDWVRALAPFLRSRGGGGSGQAGEPPAGLKAKSKEATAGHPGDRREDE